VRIEVICQFAVKFLSVEMVFLADTRTGKLLARVGLTQSTRSSALTSIRMLPVFWAAATSGEHDNAAAAISTEAIDFMK
jgi:hypothetical protein